MAFAGRTLELIKIHVVVAAKNALPVFVVSEGGPDAVPGSVFTKLECHAGVTLVPPLLSLSRIERLVGQCDENAVIDGEGNI